VGALEVVEVDVPIHPAAWGDDGLGEVLGALADILSVLGGNQFLGEEDLNLLVHGGGTTEALGGQVLAHLFAHEHGVGADVNDAALVEDAGYEGLDLGIDEGLAAADRNHGSVAFLGGAEAILEGHEVLDGCGVLTDAAAAGASQVAGVKRFKLENGGEFLRAADFVLDDVRCNFGRERQWESHTLVS